MNLKPLKRAADSGLFWFLAAGLAVLLVGLAARAQTTQPAGIGTWYQPVDSFGTWRARGVMTLIGVELEGGRFTKAQYLAAAKAAGLTVWEQSDLLEPADDADPTIAGVMLRPDEPDGVGSQTPAQVQAEAARVRTLTRKPRLINFDGNAVPWRPIGDYVEYCKAAEAIAFDLYPQNFGKGAGGLDALRAVAAKVKAAADGKPLWACVETSDQRLHEQDWTQQDDGTGVWLSTKMRGPTVAEFTDEVRTLLDCGASTLVYFPDVIGKGWVTHDGTPDDIAAAMLLIKAALPGDVLGDAGSSAATQPTGPPATQPSTQPATQPVVTPPPLPLVAWTMARDVKHGRIVVTLPPVKRGRPARQVFITDPDVIAAFDAAAGR
jgi:hypothetical protein